MSNGRGSSGGKIGGDENSPSSASMKEQMGQVVSALVQVAASDLKGLKAVFTEVNAEDEKVVVQPAGLKQVELENKTVKQLVNDQVKLSDLFKIFGLKALSLVLNNPIPLILANRIEKNISERAKAKENALKNELAMKLKEAKKQERESKKQERELKRKTLQQKYGASINQVKALQQKLKLMEKEAKLAEKGMKNTSQGKQYSDSDKKNIGSAKSSLVKMGFKQGDATKIINSALNKGSSPTDLSKLLGDSLKEADSYKKNS